MSDDSAAHATRLTDREVRSVLARAIELDHDGPMIDESQLRDIASQIGVSPHALSASLAERERRLAATAKTSLPAYRIALIGLTAGLLDAAISAPYQASPGGLILLALTGALAASGVRPAFRAFIRRNVILWSGFAVAHFTGAVLSGTFLFGEARIERFGSIMLAYCFWTSVVGAVIVFARKRLHAQSPGPDVRDRLPLRRRIAARLKDVVDWVFRSTGIARALPGVHARIATPSS